MKKTQDIANSPAYHTRFLFVGCPRVVTASDAEEGGWIRAFSGVERLDVDGGDERYRDSGLRSQSERRRSPSLLFANS